VWGVVSLPDYGAFIDLEDGIEGLLHVSEMGERTLEPEEWTDVKVIAVDEATRRISLSVLFAKVHVSS
jgi:small subunit ribosomal protein S1